ncbi:hypothetical protein H5410_010778 [Solanum commersonii]|uniref:Uncharacterized protein n=1 Tax=Solanum commersonii TaxID=4109 RepID=A0A9J6ALN1_SOLCO|nr:hypothetical protein H5410_010778 [Solanum commersonii]
MAEDTVSCSMDTCQFCFLDAFNMSIPKSIACAYLQVCQFVWTTRRNNNVLDHVAMQNETTGNKDGKANACDNGLAPHHMDTT